jgi:hypothetical protein
MAEAVQQLYLDCLICSADKLRQVLTRA